MTRLPNSSSNLWGHSPSSSARSSAIVSRKESRKPRPVVPSKDANHPSTEMESPVAMQRVRNRHILPATWASAAHRSIGSLQRLVRGLDAPDSGNPKSPRQIDFELA